MLRHSDVTNDVIGRQARTLGRHVTLADTGLRISHYVYTRTYILHLAVYK